VQQLLLKQGDVEGVGESGKSKAHKEEGRTNSGVVWGVGGGVGHDETLPAPWDTFVDLEYICFLSYRL
jgi:hypothetical protein